MKASENPSRAMCCAALAVLGVLAGAAAAPAEPAHPLAAALQGAASAPLCRAGTNCSLKPSSNQELYFDVNGEQVIYTYVEKKHLLVWCGSSMFAGELPFADEPALPALPRRAAVDRVELRGCRLPRASLAAALTALNVSTVATLELVVPDDDALLERRHLANLSVKSLVITAKSLTTETGFLNDTKGLTSLRLYGVQLSLEARQSLPESLIKLNMNNPLGAPPGSLQWLARLRSLRALTILERGAAGARLAPPALALFPNLTDVYLQLPLTVPPRWLNGSALKSLTLNDCQLIDLPVDMFEGVNLTKLSLVRNNLSSLPLGLLASQRWLRELDVSSAALSGPALAALVAPLVDLAALRASDNPLGSLCDDNNYASRTSSRLPRSLELLQLRGTRATKICADWLDEAGALAEIDLSLNRIEVIQYDALSMKRTPSRMRTEAVTLHLDRNLLREIQLTEHDVADCRAEPAAAPHLRSRVPVLLSLSEVPCDCGSTRLREMLRDCRLLRLVRDVPCAPSAPRAPPAPAPRTLLALNPDQMLCPCEDDFDVPGCSCGMRLRNNATVINCTGPLSPDTRWPESSRERPLALRAPGAGLRAAPRAVLEELRAANNSIRELPDINDTLLVLDLRNNSISHISVEAARRLGSAGRDGAARTVWLAGNPLACECADRDAIESLKSAKVQAQVQDWKELRCRDGREISALVPSELCPNPLYPALAGVAAIVLALVLLALYLLRLARPRFKQFLFDRQLCLKWVMHTEDATEDSYKTRDVFISYAHPDRMLAVKLLRWLEECGYSTVEHSRDWDAGVPVAEQITNSVLCARRTLLLVTDSFTESEWGLQEFRAAHAHALKRGSARVIPVRCALSAPNALPEDLRRYLYNNTYLSWDDPEFWSKLLRVMPARRSGAAPARAPPVCKEPPLAEQISLAASADYAPAAC